MNGRVALLALANWRRDLRLATEGSTVMAWRLISQEALAYSAAPRPAGRAVTSAWKVKAVSGPEGTSSRCLSRIRSSIWPNKAR